MNEKLYVVRKYIMAKSATEAIKKEVGMEVDDVWIDEDWKKENVSNEKVILGF